MYLRLAVVEDAEMRAELKAFDDRMRYKKFIEAGEQFAAKHGLIVCGDAATRLLLGGGLGDVESPPELGLDSFQYNLFSDHAVAHARALGDAMYQLDPQGLGHYTTVLTKVTDYLLTVSVDSRDLFMVTALLTHRGIRTADVVIPSKCLAQFAKDKDGAPLRLLCAGPEIQLIGIYSALCNPAKVSSWEGLLVTEASLRKLFGQVIRAKIATAVVRMGGANPAATRLYNILRDKYVVGPGRVLIGPAAIALLTGKSGGRIQVITAGQLESDAQEITALAKAAGFKVSWKVDDPKLPTEPRLRRMAVHVIVGRRREPLLDVYNSAAFDLVPYVTLAATSKKPAEGRGPPVTLKIGTPFVLMRYWLIDMWLIQVLMRMNAISAEYANTVLHDMLAGYDTTADYYETVLAGAAQDPEAAAHQLIPLTAYIGQLEEPELALKRAVQGKGANFFHPPYLPAARVKPAPA